ncbi:N-acetylmuramoyl-L-alanine amidase [Calditrichota bacterium GD2]
MAVFCTDAGHGGVDSGAVWQGVREKDINLQTTLQLNQWLKQKGHRVFTTRRSDDHVPPLRTRCKLVNAHHRQKAPAFDAIISIHCNVAARFEPSLDDYLPLPQRRGLYVIYSEESQTGTQLAQAIARACEEQGIQLAHGGKISTVELGRSLAWIHQTLPPAVLVELGFLTNPEERALLQDASYQQTLIQAIAAGLENAISPFT